MYYITKISIIISWLICISNVLIISVNTVSKYSPSKQTTRKFNLNLYNDLNEKVYLYWINFNGDVVLVKTLYTKEKYLLESYVGHRWIVKKDKTHETIFELGKDNLMYSGSNYKVTQLGFKSKQITTTQTPFVTPKPGPGVNSSIGEIEKCIATFENKMLELHNYKRSVHGVTPLKLNKQLSMYAKRLSNRLSKIDSLTSSFSRNPIGMGQNLGLIYNSAFNFNNSPYVCAEIAFKVFRTWYDGESFYDYFLGKFSLKTGSFTQIVWASTTEIGCGFSCNEKNRCYASCNYKMPGNVRGQFTENVFSPKNVEIVN